MKKTKKTIALLLACLILMSSCSKENQTTPDNPENPRETQTAAEGNSLTHIYKEERIPLPEGVSVHYSVPCVYTDNRLKFYNHESRQEGETYIVDHYIYEVNTDGTDFTKTKLDFSSIEGDSGIYIDRGVLTDDGMIFSTAVWDDVKEQRV